MAPSNVPAALLLLLLLASSGPLRPTLSGAAPLEPVAVSLLASAQEKGAFCLDGTPPGYHLQRGSVSDLLVVIMVKSEALARDGVMTMKLDDSFNGAFLLTAVCLRVSSQGGGWCSTVKDCSGRRMSVLGSSNFMKPLQFTGHGIFDSDEIYNPDFYNWNKVYVRYCDGASFAGDAEGQAQDGTTVYFRGLRIYEAVIGELMEKGLANATQVLFTGCSAGGLATILHCDDFSARFPQQNVRQVLHKDCLANKDPTECFFPTELIKSIRTPMFILNSAYDSWQNIAKVVGDWYFGRSQGVKEIDCEYPCNPTCNSLPPP
uniref:Pectin acetylesterase n=1 Tax=Aegilops tauschii TaxID=37682 RepID=M8CQU0_AEGTA